MEWGLIVLLVYVGVGWCVTAVVWAFVEPEAWVGDWQDWALLAGISLLMIVFWPLVIAVAIHHGLNS